MILLDCGNSQLKAQCHRDGRLQASFACAWKIDWQTRLENWLDSVPSARAYQCSVLDPERQARLDACLAERFGDRVVRFRSEAQSLGVVNGYDDPTRLGADRWMAILAAAGLSRRDCVVIDAGSAITVDLLRADGRHLGGAILPGFNTSNEQFRRIFSHIDFEHPAIAQRAAPGCSTEAAIQIDYDHPSIDRLPELVNRWIPLLDANPELLLAGGDAARVQGLLGQASRILPDLVFRGMLRLIAR
jgi:type III pantothenate kinase